MITVRVVGIDGEERTCETVADARKVALELAARYPQRWVDAKREDGEVVLRIEPRSIMDDGDPVDIAEPLPDQESMF